MSEFAQYQAIYQDDYGVVNIIIENDFNVLKTEIDGVKFEGREFSDFVLQNREKYTEAQIKRFSFLSVQVIDSEVFEEILCNCSFQITIPQTILNIEKNTAQIIALNLQYALGKPRPLPKGGLEFENMQINFELNQIKYEASGDYFESVFDQLKHQLGEKYRFKNCYGCMYGDYSVYGQSAFGSMQCFVNQAEAYKKVKSKADYLTLGNDFAFVQEIYCCNQFEIREKGAGYRG
jgi:hypothetical protein